MKALYKLFIIGLFASFASFTAVASDTYVNGYYKSNGTYVQGHHRTSPNKTKSDNYSTKGNTNPYTGKKGTKSPYGSSSTKKK